MQIYSEKSKKMITKDSYYATVIIIFCIYYYYCSIIQRKLMRTITFQPKTILQTFYKYKILTIDRLKKLCGCSRKTVWRILSDHGYLSSYNFNAKYYTLIDIPQFDDYGLWSFRKVSFSRYGSLTNTIIELVNQSKAGFSASEIEDILKVAVKPSLLGLYKRSKISREKVDKVFIYFAMDADQHNRQLMKRQSQLKSVLKDSLLPQTDRIIAVLVELVKKGDSEADNIAKRLSGRGLHVSVKEVKAIFTYYDLVKKND